MLAKLNKDDILFTKKVIEINHKIYLVNLTIIKNVTF